MITFLRGIVTFDDFFLILAARGILVAYNLHRLSVSTRNILSATLKSHHATVRGFVRATSLGSRLNLRLHHQFLGSEHLQLTQQSILKLNAMVDLLDGGEFKARVHDFLNVIHLNKMTRGGKLDLSYLLFWQTILQAIFLNQDLLLFRSKSSSLVDQETKFSDTLNIT